MSGSRRGRLIHGAIPGAENVIPQIDVPNNEDVSVGMNYGGNIIQNERKMSDIDVIDVEDVNFQSLIVESGLSDKDNVGIENEYLESMILDESGVCDVSCAESSVEVEIDPHRFIVSQLQMDVAKLKRRCTYLSKSNRVLRAENRALKKKTAAVSSSTDLIKQVFKSDQIRKLQTKNFRGNKWSNATITKSLQLKFTCGTAGYNAILRQNLPFPATRTLRHRLQNLKFQEGILDEVFEFLNIKVDIFDCFQRECTLDIDEMSISPGVCFDRANDERIGMS